LKGEAPRSSASAWLLVPAGFLIGWMGSMCGIGGGLFAVPLLHYMQRIELPRAVASGLVLVFATTSISTLTELAQGAPNCAFGIIAALAAGALIGAKWGFLVARRVNARTLKLIFVFVLLAAGARILLLPAETGAVLGAASEASWREWILSFAVGIGGGFVAPLLGVGGGLLMVPGLYLGIEGLGFAGARTASLAAGTLASARSLRLHSGAGRVIWPLGLRLGLGAAGGAVLGVLLVRDPQWVAVGRWLLGSILCFTALRFAWDLLRGRDAR
jgi:uncharacterized membrane protein YfcA